MVLLVWVIQKNLVALVSKFILLYLVTTAVALIIALGLASVLQPGLGMDLVAEKAPDIKEAPGFIDVFSWYDTI